MSIEYVRRVLDVMVRTDRHIFQVLIKRPRRMAKLAPNLPWPPHVWAGTSVELDRYAWRSNVYLLDAPSAIQFVSAEPLLGLLPSLELDHLDWVITGARGDHGIAHAIRLDARPAGSMRGVRWRILPYCLSE